MSEEKKRSLALYRKLKARLKELKENGDFYQRMANENFDKYLRAMADMDNYRKRAAKEYLEKENEANRNLVGKILPVLDNLDRALNSSKGMCEENEALQSFYQGLQMIDQQIHRILEAEGLTLMKCEGQPFDPTKHEAVLAIESDQYPPNTVINEVEKGFMFRDKVLRPARVTVAKAKESGEQKTEEAPPETGMEEEPGE